MTETKADIINVSPSELEAMSCRLSWFWQYRCRYTPNRSSLALEFGSAIHAALEAYYQGKDALAFWHQTLDGRVRMSEAQGFNISDLEQMREEGASLLDAYRQKYENDGISVIATERFLSRMVPNPYDQSPSNIRLNARLDTIVRENGKIFALEHKTFHAFQPGALTRDHQITAQYWLGQEALVQLGVDEPMAGVIYNGLRKGKVSDKSFVRERIWRTDHHVKIFLHRVYSQVREATADGAVVYPQPNAIRCSGCSYRGPCQAYMDGGDYQFLLDSDYTIRQSSRR